MIKNILLFSSVFIFIFSCGSKKDTVSSSAVISSNNENTQFVSESSNKNSIVDIYASVLDEAKQKYGYDSYNDYILIANTEEKKM